MYNTMLFRLDKAQVGSTVAFQKKLTKESGRIYTPQLAANKPTRTDSINKAIYFNPAKN